MIMTTSDTKNPWEKMASLSRRRVESKTPHDLFWITDINGNYGFLIYSKKIFKKIVNSLDLKEISVIKKNNEDGQGELYIFLNKKEDWQIFLTLCNDLISVTHKFEMDEKMVHAAEDRLSRWQQLFRQNFNEEMPLERQMGLFAELLCLKDVIMPKTGVAQAIISWVGPDFDKQDFLLEDSVLEVKSYRTSKGPVVQISSAQQLFSEKVPLFLISFALTTANSGQSIDDVSKIIFSKLEDESAELRQMFEGKLIEYGYIPNAHRIPLFKFIADKQKLFKISDSFPKIVPSQLKSQISSVKYSIDLSKCEEFEVKLGSLFSSKK